MKKYTQETIAGLFVLIGLIMLGYMTVKLGNVPFLNRNYYSLFASFTTVTGLRAGNPVEMLGIEIGEVKACRIDQEKRMAVVELRIRQGIKIYSDAIASVKTAGLIGDRYVSIDPGGGGELLKEGGDIFETEPPLDIGDLIGKYVFGSVPEEKAK